MATGGDESIFKAQSAFLMTSLKLTTASFWVHCIIYISENIRFLSIDLDLKHTRPNIGKIFNINIILITKYLNLNLNIVKSLIFMQKMIDFKDEFSKLWLVSDGCFVLNLIPYCIILRYSAHFDNWLGFCFRYTHASLCTSEYWPNLWTRFNFLCGLLSVSDDTDYS